MTNAEALAVEWFKYTSRGGYPAVRPARDVLEIAGVNPTAVVHTDGSVTLTVWQGRRRPTRSECYQPATPEEAEEITAEGTARSEATHRIAHTATAALRSAGLEMAPYFGLGNGNGLYVTDWGSVVTVSWAAASRAQRHAMGGVRDRVAEVLADAGLHFEPRQANFLLTTENNPTI
ncbi:hypothetical protein OG800_49285 (plasmid) [Streptomyces sp. NBC_00445]|uniref:hypothetical protein n=1 Tax=Streptomyces sp. NBC_00445 TaxID=2975745 RepID=UPI002E2166E9